MLLFHEDEDGGKNELFYDFIIELDHFCNTFAFNRTQRRVLYDNVRDIINYLTVNNNMCKMKCIESIKVCIDEQTAPEHTPSEKIIDFDQIKQDIEDKRRAEEEEYAAKHHGRKKPPKKRKTPRKTSRKSVDEDGLVGYVYTCEQNRGIFSFLNDAIFNEYELYKAATAVL